MNTIILREFDVSNYLKISKIFLNLPRISRIFTKLRLYKTLYFILSHEFSPDGELVCEYIMLQSCKSIFCYIELTLILKHNLDF